MVKHRAQMGSSSKPHVSRQTSGPGLETLLTPPAPFLPQVCLYAMGVLLLVLQDGEHLLGGQWVAPHHGGRALSGPWSMNGKSASDGCQGD